MNFDHQIAKELNLLDKQVRATIQLLDEGATIPFIARYRKELTGGLDEVAIADIRDTFKRHAELLKRKEAVLKSLEEQNVLTDELKVLVETAESMSLLEDIYLPFKPKRRTRASMAKERGLEPLANLLKEQVEGEVLSLAQAYVNKELEVHTAEEALAGARDILAEQISENLQVRTMVRELILDQGRFVSTVIEGKEEAGQKYKDYFEWSERVNEIASHRLLAMRRGEKEEILSLNIEMPTEEALSKIDHLFVSKSNEAAAQIRLAIADGFKRLIKPSIETEVRLLTKQKADEEAIRVFALNVRQLLLEPPLGQKRMIALDPGFRTGCKLVCLDEQGVLLENQTIYPHNGAGKAEAAKEVLTAMAEKHKIEVIAIGNGTAGRETEAFVKSLGLKAMVVMVNESGASIYSASKVAREEFPDQDITVRGAVSIGRRLMDPLAELVKIDPKSIGVGQYQHDVDQNKLQGALDDTVVSCVNSVGVSLNTASKEILSYVSGLGPSLAQNIINYRNANGAFKNRMELKKVPRLGEKAFEQSAGFLRISDSSNVLDASAVHPERYDLVNQMAKDLGCTVEALIKEEKLRKQLVLERYVDDTIGLPTLQDILAELARPGRDPREEFEAFSFTEGVHDISDLKVGMRLPGKVTNITKFGAFVDIGVHQDGLVHLSQLANRYISDANEVVKVNQIVEVRVTEVDSTRNRIALSMKDEFPASRKTQSNRKEAKNAQRKPKNKERAKDPQKEMNQKLAALVKKFG